ncbi:unnamed protein product [Prunus armeniaca]
MSNHGSDEVRSDSFLEDLQVSQRSAVLQCSKVELEDSNGSVCEDNKTGIGRACAHDGKENRFFVKKWQKRQRTARDQQRHWVKEQPSYRYPAVENSVWVESMVIVWKLRAAPALLSNWAKGPPGKPNTAPAHHLQSGQVLGPTSPGKPKGRFCLGFSPRVLTSTSKKKI